MDTRLKFLLESQYCFKKIKSIYNFSIEFFAGFLLLGSLFLFFNIPTSDTSLIIYTELKHHILFQLAFNFLPIVWSVSSIIIIILFRKNFKNNTHKIKEEYINLETHLEVFAEHPLLKFINIKTDDKNSLFDFLYRGSKVLLIHFWFYLFMYLLSPIIIHFLTTSSNRTLFHIFFIEMLISLPSFIIFWVNIKVFKNLIYDYAINNHMNRKYGLWYKYIIYGSINPKELLK
ncbi:hypothetical protein NW739_02290 [Mycoplasmopsis felis]|uniref:hypothetical protein n=1 Tax=Mycoplasmopsis felis TaxID=33923 RepID=UPI0021AF528F|nr:hypothetical protein [Mycoplasmopsis felis]MCU9934019.1 hypothetical protein [Mycoplasmopsis felis]MCU9939615.1 hypothetical protein [Mycoplasmopsis felis]UWV80002.1 hypothetical protein NW072_02570 [Mycoplasmopsis felis]UWV85066.1 hypothetical protein NW066_06155 [Mycoplasmopsis felis]WAM01262.1 hypothetical protein NWE60_01170 [Mycoplasmopsis felis]